MKNVGGATHTASPASQQSHKQVPDLPSLEAMQASSLLQSRVDDRMTHLEGLSDQQLQNSGKFRSQRGGKDVVFVKRQVPWPQNQILGGRNKERISYDDLDVFQWVAGYAGIVKDETDLDTKNIMLEHLMELMEDAHDFSWVGSKAAHAVILTKIEDCKLEWDDHTRLDRIRRQNQRAEPPKIQSNVGKAKSGSDKKVCQFYQRKACHSKSQEHLAKGVWYKHICSSCFAFGKELEHPAKECPELKKLTKNVHLPTLTE